MPTINIEQMRKYADMPPTMMCAVCGKMENPNADIARGDFWLCTDCLEKLRKLIGEAGDNDGEKV